MIDNTIPMRLRRTYLTMHRAAQFHFSTLGVTVDQYVLLSVLAEQDGITQSEACERMSSDASTTGAMLRLLEGRGLLRRKQCKNDGRARRIHLTASGKRLSKKLIDDSREMHELIDSSFSKHQRMALLQSLDRLYEVFANVTQSNGKNGE